MKEMTGSTLSHLECSNCNQVYDADERCQLCPSCAAPLLARYDLATAVERIVLAEIAKRENTVWRWRELLPVRQNAHVITLGEGGTPLIPARALGTRLGLSALYIKDESQNPTGTFKARGLSVAVSRARELGVNEVSMPSAGNAGGAMAAYAARGGLQAHIYMPEDTPPPNIAEVRMYGADLVLVKGLINRAGELASQEAQGRGWFNLATFKEPYRLEGKKTMGYELALQFAVSMEEQLELPEVILYPTGGGTGLVGMWKAFDEMERMGWIGRNRPRMVAAQAEGCAPIVRAFCNGDERAEPWGNAYTVAAGLRVPSAVGDRLILKTLRESNGIAVAVSDDAILEAQAELASAEGILAAPEGAACVAALDELVAKGWLHANERIVLFNTGTGIKYSHLFQER